MTASRPLCICGHDVIQHDAIGRCHAGGGFIAPCECWCFREMGQPLRLTTDRCGADWGNLTRLLERIEYNTRNDR